MDSVALLHLVDIIDAGNISAAARRLKMTRANVSYHLNQLERNVGAQLLRRTTRSLEPTEMGLQLYHQGCVIRNALAEAREATSLRDTPRGRVRLSVPIGYGQLVLAPWLLEFKRLHPSIDLDVIFDTKIRNLINDEVDVSVRVLSDPPQNLESRDLGPVSMLICASRPFAAEHGLPQTLDELRNFPIIAGSPVGKKLRVAGIFKGVRHEIVLEPSLASDNFLFLRQALLQNLGVGVTTDYVVRDQVASGEIVRAMPEWSLSIYGNRMHLLFMPDQYRIRAVTTLIEFLAHKGKTVAAMEQK
ncbi:LysR family transcriptional regulator [Advenella kashmirensis W13003]|uniref:LysR family transcriptional regulator n=1 Tax=Advenella kashmirensis W13003 TaxID=1424334 RepID=V8QYJ6_9BURK|nr:LysR family transcriptional regulator [Advenella kashmirensis]ETF04453.1 LysR family transcriptional regulator [Advenella kashmirensis W13003]